MKILVFDTETTGLPERDASIYQLNKWPHIIQLSYILYDLSNNSTLIKDHYIKLNSNITISSESYEKHHLDHTYLNNHGIHIKQALYEFNEALKICNIVVGHNISFDKRLIFVECLRHKVKQFFTTFNGENKITKPEYCTMKNSTKLCNIIRLNKANKLYIKSPSLTELYEKLFPDSPIPSELHNSMVDILCTFRCYMKLAYNIDIVQNNEKIYELFLQLK